MPPPNGCLSHSNQLSAKRPRATHSLRKLDGVPPTPPPPPPGLGGLNAATAPLVGVLAPRSSLSPTPSSSLGVAIPAALRRSLAPPDPLGMLLAPPGLAYGEKDDVAEPRGVLLYTPLCVPLNCLGVATGGL